jgi:thiaminase/transcriptional activator TenA
VTWGNEAWQAIEPIFSAITIHPFVTGLIDGRLAKEKFLYYINQDYLYLNHFSRVLSGLAMTVQRQPLSEFFLDCATRSMAVERELHRSYLRELNPNQRLSPTCELYVSYLYKRLTLGPVETAVAAVLPCFWIYQKVGDFILADKANKPASINPYQAWIDTYGSELYAATVAKAVALANTLAEETTPIILARMKEAFVMTSKMEWMFWDSAWRLEVWPI